MTQELPPRQRSQRLLDQSRKTQHVLQFQDYMNRSRVITNINELLPGLNDISDALEALPTDIIKYFTLLKEIDAKCINTVPAINHSIKDYLGRLHTEEEGTEDDKARRLLGMKDNISDIIPCLEEKMHVTSIAADVIEKHLFRINNDYKLIISNNEIPESIRIGPLTHPAMIIDSSGHEPHPNRSAQSSRSESRREALAARKHGKDDSEPNTSKKEQLPAEKKKRGRQSKEKVVSEKEQTIDEISRPATPQAPRKKMRKEETNGEPTYCYCNQVSFGEMVGCDGDDCKREWFHLPCIGFKNPPKGKWYCDDCLLKQKKIRQM